MKTKLAILLLIVLLGGGSVSAQPTEQQLARWLKRFPAADANGDGRLTVDEANTYRRKLQQPRKPSFTRGRGAPRDFAVQPGWQADRFPDHAVSNNPLSGVTDDDQDGIDDDRE